MPPTRDCLRSFVSRASSSVRLRARVLRPLPRRDSPRVYLRTEAWWMLSSPRHDRFGYSALRRLPRQDLHLLEKNSMTQTSNRLHQSRRAMTRF
jgi:hypothetical protein